MVGTLTKVDKNGKRADIFSKEIKEIDKYIIKNFNSQEDINNYYKCINGEKIKLYVIYNNELKYLHILFKEDIVKITNYLKNNLINDRELIEKLIINCIGIFREEIREDLRHSLEHNFYKNIIRYMRGYVKKINNDAIENNIRMVYRSIKLTNKTKDK